MKVFHISMGVGQARKAFCKPESWRDKVWLYLRGYRPNWIGPCWTKDRP
jgi:hypothetical protein